MLDMGFEPQIRKIIEQIRVSTQNIHYLLQHVSVFRKCFSSGSHLTLHAVQYSNTNTNKMFANSTTTGDLKFFLPVGSG